MIKLSTLTANLENALNNGLSGLTFKLHTDTATYADALRVGNDVKDVVNGIVTNTASDVKNTSDGLIYGTFTNRVELIVKCRDTDEDVFQLVEGANGTERQLVELGTINYIQKIRDLLDGFTAEQRRETLTDDDAKSYDVSSAYSLALSGVRAQISPIGDCYTFVFYAYYNVIENGENSKDWTAKLDGDVLSYGTFTIRRVPTQDAFTYSGDKTASAKSLSSSHVLAVTFELPAISGKVNSTIKKYLLEGENNVAHILTLRLGNETKSYLVIFGQVDGTASGVLNVGQSVTFVETAEEYGLISISPNLYAYVYTKTATSLSLGIAKNSVVYSFASREFYGNNPAAESDTITIDVGVTQNCVIIATQELSADGLSSLNSTITEN